MKHCGEKHKQKQRTDVIMRRIERGWEISIETQFVGVYEANNTANFLGLSCFWRRQCGTLSFPWLRSDVRPSQVPDIINKLVRVWIYAGLIATLISAKLRTCYSINDKQTYCAVYERVSEKPATTLFLEMVLYMSLLLVTSQKNNKICNP